MASLPVADLFAPAPDAMIEPTGAWAEHLEAVRLASAEDGYDSGYREGFEAGALAAEAANQTARPGQRLGVGHGRRSAQLAETDRRVAADLSDDALHHLAFDLANSSSITEIHTADDPGLDAIRRCFDFIPRRTSVVVRLNPADAEMLGDVGAVLIGADYEVVADPTIGRGGAIVDAGAARIDGQIDAALGRVADVLGITSRGTSGRTAGGR
ncbi:MAG: FliH/SctL family protein [Acidimicrobiales bacterium]